MCLRYRFKFWNPLFYVPLSSSIFSSITNLFYCPSVIISNLRKIIIIKRMKRTPFKRRRTLFSSLSPSFVKLFLFIYYSSLLLSSHELELDSLAHDLRLVFWINKFTCTLYISPRWFWYIFIIDENLTFIIIQNIHNYERLMLWYHSAYKIFSCYLLIFNW